VAEDIRALSAALAGNPASLVYADLAEALRRRGDLEQALRVAKHGVARHPEHADGLDCLGRVYSDLGDLARAAEAWGRALALAPEHVGALKGMGFALYRRGDARGAEEMLARAVAVSPRDEAARRALETVRRAFDAAPLPPAPSADVREAPVPARAAPSPPSSPSPAESAYQPEQREAPHRGGTGAAEPAPAAASPDSEAGPTGAGSPETVAALPPVFEGFEGATADILLLDDRGLVVAGGLRGGDGRDVSELAAAALAGVSGEAGRTARYLALGEWRTIVAEAADANLVLAPVGAGAMLLVRRDRSMPVGLTLRVAERARGAASLWLERQGA